jgi:hypothetical protein
MAEIKILEPERIAKYQAEYIFKASLDICMAIKADTQGKDKSWVDKKVDAFIDLLEKFKAEEISENAYTEIMKEIDELISTTE